MRCGDVIDHILDVKKINKEKFWNSYSAGQRVTIRGTDRLLPSVKEIARELNVEPYFLVKWKDEIKDINHFPTNNIEKLYVSGKQKPIYLNQTKFIEDYLQILTAKVVYRRFKEGYERCDIGSKIGIKLLEERERDLLKYNVIENEVSVLYEAKMEFCVNLKIYHFFYTKKRMRFILKEKCVVKDLYKGTVEHRMGFYFEDGRYLGEVILNKVDECVKSYCSSVVDVIKEFRKRMRNNCLYLGEETEYLEELQVGPKVKEEKVKFLEKQTSMKDIIWAYEEAKKNDIYD